MGIALRVAEMSVEFSQTLGGEIVLRLLRSRVQATEGHAGVVGEVPLPEAVRSHDVDAQTFPLRGQPQGSAFRAKKASLRHRGDDGDDASRGEPQLSGKGFERRVLTALLPRQDMFQGILEASALELFATSAPLVGQPIAG